MKAELVDYLMEHDVSEAEMKEILDKLMINLSPLKLED